MVVHFNIYCVAIFRRRSSLDRRGLLRLMTNQELLELAIYCFVLQRNQVFRAGIYFTKEPLDVNDSFIQSRTASCFLMIIFLPIL